MFYKQEVKDQLATKIGFAHLQKDIELQRGYFQMMSTHISEKCLRARTVVFNFWQFMVR